MLKLSILSIALLTIVVVSAVTPILGLISGAFPDAHPDAIKMIITLPSIVFIFVNLLAGRLALVVKKRQLLIVGLVLYLIGGVGGGFANRIEVLLLFRGILGAGSGIVAPLATSLIADFFLGEERAQMMGYSSAVANLGAIITTLLAGWLSLINWRFSFSAYLLGIVALLLCVFALPEPERMEEETGQKVALPVGVYVLGVLAFLMMVAFFIIPTSIAIFIQNERIGNAAVSGLAVATLTFASFLVGMLFARITGLLRQFTVPISLLCTGAGFFALGSASALDGVLLGLACIGLGMGVIGPLLAIRATDLMPRHASTPALAIINSAMYLGQFVSPMMFSFVGKFGGNPTTRFSFQVAAISFTAAGAIAVLIAARSGKLPCPVGYPE